MIFLSPVEVRGQILPATLSLGQRASTNYKPGWRQKAFPTETEHQGLGASNPTLLVGPLHEDCRSVKNILAELRDLSGLTQI